MNWNILSSGTLALAIHALVFALPLSKTMGRTSTPINRPISLSIIHPQKTVAAVPQVEVTAEAGIVQQPFETKSSVSEIETVISKKQITPKKPLTADRMTVKQSRPEEAVTFETTPSLANQEDTAEDISPDHMPRDRGKKTVSTASIGSPEPRHTTDAQPKYKENPPPLYPKIARRRGYEGRTVLRVEVLESGRVGQLEIATSSGFDVLDNAALESVKGWSFFPGTRNGNKIRQWVMVPVRFSLR
jgi:protein TonB